MLEITGEHVGKLDDTDLRILVTRLCEAELRRCGLPLSAVTAGGDQNAPDGGIDVRVDLATESECLDFILRPHTGFQVKCSDIPANKIIAEMRPKGGLRPSIRNLIVANGAYVIVSSQGSTADSALLDRRNTMQEAIGDSRDGGTIRLDFYDRHRVANWVRNYPGVCIWLRERINEPLAGWKGYGAWAYNDTNDSEYLLDDTARVVSRQSDSHTPMTVEQGIVAMREILAQPGGIIRLVGLSGVGKTRLVQALFDSRVGTSALDSAVVAYTDQSHEPNPTAREMLQRIGASGLRAIVVVDNCNPATHRALVESVRAYASCLSLITVEYDVADDEPEETQVFELEPASEKVLAGILKSLAPHISQNDRGRIAEFSGGNARIALALAKTIKSHENLGNLNDAELFKRLFHQRQESSEALIRAAEVCSLVYSFDGESLEGDPAELPILADLADLSAKELFRHVAELRARDLVQRRSRWRAVLPHAIANRLARQALGHIPTDLITKTFSQAGRERLLVSFSRRLSYLHDCEPAKRIAEGWFSGTLANLARLNELGITLFCNLAPIAPKLVLEALEVAALQDGCDAFLSPENPRRSKWATLLRKLAYDPELFDRAAFLLANLSAGEPEDHNFQSTRGTFKGLFHLYLSGTHAKIEQRLAFIRRLLDSDNPNLQACALEALDAMMEAWHFHSSHDFCFGAHSRDFGWEPKTSDELANWFQASIGLARELSVASSLYRQHARSMLARHFRALWRGAGIPEDLELLAKELSAQDGWPDGWIAVRMTIRFDIDRMLPELSRRLCSLEADLRPRDLVQKIQAYALSRTHHQLDIADAEESDHSDSDHQKAWAKVNQIVEELGREASTTPTVLTQVLPECLRHGPGQHWQFGRGLALGAERMETLWQQFRDILATLPENERNVSLLQGFINAAFGRDPNSANRFLDQAVNDPVLGPYFPPLQASVQVDDVGAKRLTTSLSIGLAQAWAYRYLGYGRVADAIPMTTYKQIVLRVADLTDGFAIAVDLLIMRMHSMKSEKIDIDEETVALGRELLMRTDFHACDSTLDYHLKEIATACLRGDDAYDAALKVCTSFAHALSDYRSSAWCYDALVRTLFTLQPSAALNTLLNGHTKSGFSALSDFSDRNESPVNCATLEVLIAWADENPSDRYPKLAWHVQLFKKDGDHEASWSPLALRLLEQAPDQTSIMDIFSSRLRPASWSGSRADALGPYLRLVHELTNHLDTLIAAWARSQEVNLTRQIEEERQRDRRVDESFE